MKKLLPFLLCLVLAASVLVACGNTDTPATETEPEETINPLGDSVKTEATVTEAEPEETTPPVKTLNEADFDYFKVFKAPEGKPGDIIMDYMLKMAKIEWVAEESWNTTWKVQGDFGVNLSYEKGKTYYGIPYSQTKCGASAFEIFIVDGKFNPHSPYYEEIIGNHCSSSMGLAYQQVLDFPYLGGLRENEYRKGLVKLADGLEHPESRSEKPYDYISANVTAKNGTDKLYAAYASLVKGDILYKMIDGSGHTRMVSKVEVNKSATGKILPSRSFIYCVEQTNAWYDNNQNTTWWIDKKYTFEQLNSTNFTPYMLCILHEENPVIQDAYVGMKGKNTAESLMKIVNGTIESTFPINLVRTTVKDSKGEIVASAMKYDFQNTYKVNIRDTTYTLNIDKLPAGSYTFEIYVAIARGGWTIESVDFTIA